MTRSIIAGLLVLLAGSVAMADWDTGDPHKMHFPQEPDPFGWDVAFNSPVNPTSNTVLADDWQCSQTGPVDDIHFWISAQGWSFTDTPLIQQFRVSIREDVPAGTIPGVDYSTPGNILWTKAIDPGDPTHYTIRHYGSGQQGWYDPWSGLVLPDDHTEFFQINLDGLDTAAEPAFVQTAGEIYWLEIGMQAPTPDGHGIGWKTADLNSYPAPWTGNHFMDDAVYGVPDLTPLTDYVDLYYPGIDPPKSLDLAFVITPEPTSMVLLGIGGLAMLKRKRRG